MSLQLPTPSGCPCNFGEYVRVQVAHTGVAVAGDMECTGSSCSPPNPPTAKYPALPVFSQPSHSVALLVMLAPCITLPFSLLVVTPIRPPSPKVAVVGGEEGSTPLRCDGMGEYWDGVVWNKAEALCLDNRGVSPSPNPPFSLHFPAASASWRSARLSRGVVGGICAARHSVLK
ncbi:unnamed protein product [Closterium sp. NIES-64]|nr:unnamed protein product [Closterium sp. NIES-64]